jgi:hypothetical protein
MKYLKIFDIPRNNINFLIQGKNNVRTIFGGLINLFIFIFAVTIFNIFARDMIEKVNPNIFIQNIIEQDNRKININRPEINVIIQPYWARDSTNYYEVDFSLFTIVANNASYYFLDDGTRKQEISEIPIKPCEEKDFDKSLLDLFKKNNFGNTAYCMGIKDFEVQGQYTSPMFKFLNFKITECDGKNLKTGENVTCKSKEERDRAIGKYRASVYFTYTMPNLVNYEKPYSTQVYNLAYSLNPTSLSKDNFFFSADSLYSDDGVFSSSRDSLDINKNFEITNFNNLQASIANMDSFQKNIYLSMFYRVNPSYNYIRRSYKKLPEVFAQILPFIQLGILLSNFLVSPFRSHVLNYKIVNEAFKNTSEERRQVLWKLRKENEEKNFTQSSYNPLTYESISPIFLYKKDMTKLKTEYLKNLDSKYINNGNLNKINTELKPQPRKKSALAYINFDTRKKIWLSGNFTSFCSSKQQKNIHAQFKKKIKKSLEINTYLNLLNDIDKLQNLLLTEDQIRTLPLWNYDYFVDSQDNLFTNWLISRDEITSKTISSYNNINQATDKSPIDISLLSKITIFNS